MTGRAANRVGGALGVLSAVIAVSGTVAAQSPSRSDVDECLDAHERAQVQRKSGKLLEARQSLRACVNASCPALVQQDCGPWLAEIEANIPTVVFEASDDGEPVLDVRITVDGQEFARRLEGQTLALDPGVHSFRFERPSRPPIEQRLAVSPGEKNRLIVIAFKSPPRVGVPLPVVESSRPIPAVVWILGGVSVAAGAATAVLGASVISDRTNLANSCAPFCSGAALSSLQTKMAVTDVAAGVTAAAGLGTLIFFFARPTVTLRGGGGPEVGVTVLPRGFAAQLSESF
jgi:hypothetical protein